MKLAVLAALAAVCLSTPLPDPTTLVVSFSPDTPVPQGNQAISPPPVEPQFTTLPLPNPSGSAPEPEPRISPATSIPDHHHSVPVIDDSTILEAILPATIFDFVDLVDMAITQLLTTVLHHRGVPIGKFPTLVSNESEAPIRQLATLVYDFVDVLIREFTFLMLKEAGVPIRQLPTIVPNRVDVPIRSLPITLSDTLAMANTAVNDLGVTSTAPYAALDAAILASESVQLQMEQLYKAAAAAESQAVVNRIMQWSTNGLPHFSRLPLNRRMAVLVNT